MPRPNQIDPSDYVSIFGTTFVKREHQAVVQIGAQTWDRRELGLYGCAHPTAALKLNRVIQELRIRTLDGLAREIHTVGNYKGCGVTVYFTALAILRAEGYDPEDLHGDKVTFSTLKTRATKASRKRANKKPRRASPPSEAADAGA
jgi:hypothetical protein